MKFDASDSKCLLTSEMPLNIVNKSILWIQGYVQSFNGIQEYSLKKYKWFCIQ